VKFSFLTILSIFHKYGALSLRQGINDNFLAFLGCKVVIEQSCSCFWIVMNFVGKVFLKEL
jgi:hypothetical protein